MRNKGGLILYGRVALPLDISKERNMEYVVCGMGTTTSH